MFFVKFVAIGFLRVFVCIADIVETDVNTKKMGSSQSVFTEQELNDYQVRRLI